MTCRTISPGVVICGGTEGYRRRILHCPVDQCMTEVVVQYPDSPWYSPIAKCTKCGEKWSDGELYPRPFARGWRRRQQAEHRALWDVATYGPAPDYRDYFEAEEGQR